MKVYSKVFDLRLRHVFTTSRKSGSERKTLIVKLEHDGIVGYGEAVEDPYYGFSVDQMQKDLIELKPIIENYQFDTPELFWKYLNKFLDNKRFLHCAIDIAAHDLYGKMLNLPLFKIWNLKTDNLPLTNFTIGIDDIDVMKEKLLEMPWPLYKIKLGTENDLFIIEQLRNITDSAFRVDANTGWTVKQTIDNSRILKKLGVEFIEQPLPADRWLDMEHVFDKSSLPVIADESCRIYSDIEKCPGRFNGVNIKLAKAGGLTPSRKMILAAKDIGLKTMVGCMTESSVGIAAVGQLLPYLDYVDMDGALLLSNDIATAHSIEYGKVSLSENPGTGAILNVDF
ncbi:MAG: dipeptide epimerase [Saprospiraceae bacterium]